jgi:hypothetical protein
VVVKDDLGKVLATQPARSNSYALPCFHKTDSFIERQHLGKVNVKIKVKVKDHWEKFLIRH